MASDAMDLDDPRLYNPNIKSQLYSSSSPPPLAGQKRSRSQFEGIPPTRSCLNPVRKPGQYVEPHTAPPVPAMRLFNSIVDRVRWAARTTMGLAGRHIQRSTASARAYLASRAAPQHTAVLEDSNKRRKTGMPGAYPTSPVKDDAAIASSSNSTITPKFVAINQAAPGEDSPFTKLCKLRPAKPAASLLHNPIQVMPVALPTATVPQKTAENGLPTATMPQKMAGNGPTKPAASLHHNPIHKRPVALSTGTMALNKPGSGPTPPDSRPTSSQSNQGIKKKLPAPTRESIQPKKTRASYRQPFEPIDVSPNAEPPKPILKKTTRDTEIESLITKAKNVLIESPEEKAVRFTYRQRKREEARRDAYAFRLAREAEEARIERELEEEERAAEEAKARKERERIEAEEEKKRLRKAEEEAKKAEAAAEKQRLKEEAKKAAAAEAEERRIAHEAKLAAKRASLAEEFEDEDEDLIDALQLISTLSADWEEKIHREMSVKNLAHTVATSPDGAELSRRDFGSLLPQEGTSDDPSGWLNDEMINGFLSTIVTTKKNREGHKKGRDVPTFEAFASAWFTTYKQQGMGKLARWSKRKGIDGKNLLKCHRIFFPINTGNHWMLLIISPAFRTIEFLDSLQSSANRTKFFSIAREWLQMELQSNYKASEWTELESESMRQTNMNDCGVFTCFNALASAKYLSFELVNPNHMDKARKLMAAILIKGRLEGEFKL